MKFSNLLFALVAFGQNTLVVSTDMIYLPYATTYTFDVVAGEEPVDTIAGEALVNGCLTSSFNAIHDPTKYFIQAIIPQSETVDPVPTAREGRLSAVKKNCKFHMLECNLLFHLSVESVLVA